MFNEEQMRRLKAAEEKALRDLARSRDSPEVPFWKPNTFKEDVVRRIQGIAARFNPPPTHIRMRNMGEGLLEVAYIGGQDTALCLYVDYTVVIERGCSEEVLLERVKEPWLHFVPWRLTTEEYIQKNFVARNGVALVLSSADITVIDVKAS